MPTEKEILAAGPLSHDDPAVEVARKKISAGVVYGLLRLEEHARRFAAEQPPENDNGAAPRPVGAAPKASRITTARGNHSEEGGDSLSLG